MLLWLYISMYTFMVARAGVTALHRCAHGGNVAIMRLLIASGGRETEASSKSSFYIRYVVHGLCLCCAQSDVRIGTVTPLSIAQERGYGKMVELLAANYSSLDRSNAYWMLGVGFATCVRYQFHR